MYALIAETEPPQLLAASETGTFTLRAEWANLPLSIRLIPPKDEPLLREFFYRPALIWMNGGVDSQRLD